MATRRRKSKRKRQPRPARLIASAPSSRSKVRNAINLVLSMFRDLLPTGAPVELIVKYIREYLLKQGWSEEEAELIYKTAIRRIYDEDD